MRGLIVGVVLALAWAAPAAARPLDPSCTDTFQVVGASRDWNTAANWTNGIPGPADDVCILAGIPKVGTATPVIHSLYAPDTPLELAGDFTVTAGATVQSLAVSAGTVTVGGPLAAGSLDLSGGTVSSGSDGTLGSLVWSGGTLGGPGPTTVSGAATLVGGTLAGPLRLAGASTLSAGPGIGGTGALVAAGPLTVHAPAAIAAPFTNAGTVSVDGGALRLTGGGSGAGSYTLAAGAALDWAAGAFTLSAPHIGGAGTARVSGAAVSLTGAAQLAALDVSGGSLAVTGTLDAGPLSLSGGSLAGAGTTTATALNVTGTGATLADGTLAVAGASTLAGPLEIDGRLENAGVMDIPGDSGLSGTGLLVNTGTVRKSAGAGVTLIGVPLDNDGVLDAGTGTLRLTGGSGIGEASTGTYAAGPGATIDWRAGAYALSSPVASGPGTALVSGGTLIVTGPARFATLVLAAGGAQLSDPLTADTVSLGAATLSAAAMTLGHLSWTAGTLSAPAAGTPGTATAGGLTLSGTATKTLRHTTLALTGDSVVDATGGPLVLADGAAVRNGGLLDFRTDASVTGAGTLTNTAAGTLRKSAGTGTTAIGLALDNQGTVDVRTGTLQVAGLAGAALGGTYELAGTLLVPGLAVTANAGTLRLGSSGGLSDGTGDALAGLATNTGTLELGGHDLALAGGLANSGTVGLGGGTLTVARDYVQSAGLTRLDGGTLRAGNAGPARRRAADRHRHGRARAGQRRQRGAGRAADGERRLPAGAGRRAHRPRGPAGGVRHGSAGRDAGRRPGRRRAVRRRHVPAAHGGGGARAVGGAGRRPRVSLRRRLHRHRRDPHRPGDRGPGSGPDGVARPHRAAGGLLRRPARAGRGAAGHRRRRGREDPGQAPRGGPVHGDHPARVAALGDGRGRPPRHRHADRRVELHGSRRRRRRRSGWPRRSSQSASSAPRTATRRSPTSWSRRRRARRTPASRARAWSARGRRRSAGSGRR